MQAHSTCSLTQPAKYSPIDDPSAVSQLYLLNLLTKLPDMRSRPAYRLPDQPDRIGMRQRREQVEMTLSSLQRSRGVEPQGNPHEALLEAYVMQSGDCRLLEKECAAFWQLKELADIANQKLLECVAYLRKHVPMAREPWNAQNGFAYLEFMKRHVPQLPSLAIPGYQALKSGALKADVRSREAAERLRPERDAHMARAMLEQLTDTGLNYLIVGSDHLKDVRKLLKNRRSLFMLPRLIVKDEPSASLFAGLRDEL